MKSGSEILSDVLGHTEETINSFATVIGLKRSQNLYDIESGKIKNVSFRLASKIKSKYPEFNLNWILTGEGDMLISETKTNNSDPPQELLDRIKELEEDKENQKAQIKALTSSCNNWEEKYNELEIKYNELKNAGPSSKTGTDG